MKKVCFLLLAIGVLLTAGCSDVNDVDFGQEAEICFSLNLESDMTTRAISDGTSVTQLMWGVFDENGNLLRTKVVDDDFRESLADNKYTMTLTLARGKSYQVAFWAQSAACTAYEVSDDMKVTINYDGINNDESRDAFCATTGLFMVDDATTISVVLKRPFAQINVGAFAYDMEYAKEMGFDVAKSAAKISSVANVLNILDGSVEGNVDVDYKTSDIPTETLSVDVDGDGNKDSYIYLSMSYVLASAEGSSSEMAFTFSDQDGSSTYTFDGLGAVPIKRNYRTNIVGQVLLGSLKYDIKLDPLYDGETINSGGLYYNFTEDTHIKDQEFAFNALYEEAVFTTENNNLLTLENVKFSGNIFQIAIGDYRGKTVDDIPYTNVLKKVTAHNMTVANSIENVNSVDHMSVLFYLRGMLTLTDCTFTGTTTIAVPKKDVNGEMQEVIAYDCGVPNYCDATFDKCIIGSMYAWTHSQITLNNTKVDYLRCSAHKESYKKAHLTVGAGSEIEKIVVSSCTGLTSYIDKNGQKKYKAKLYPPSLIIKSGARVKCLDMNGRKMGINGVNHVIIEDGAIVDEIINLGE